jgi:hypothetical protein
MPNDQEMKDALREEFKHQINLWNATNYDKLAERFDENIIMKKLDDPGSVIGIGNVLAYLNKNQKSKAPQFTLDDIQDVFIWGAGTIAQVVGTATYQDRRTQTPTTEVRFVFTYSRSSVHDDWLMVNAFQARRA